MEVDLGRRRKVSVTDFRNEWWVDVREYYEKNGELNRTTKGCMLNAAAWQALLDNVDNAEARIEELENGGT